MAHLLPNGKTDIGQLFRIANGGHGVWRPAAVSKQEAFSTAPAVSVRRGKSGRRP